MKNENIELKLVKRILHLKTGEELKDGEYTINTSKGNFIVKKSKKNRIEFSL